MTISRQSILLPVQYSQFDFSSDNTTSLYIASSQKAPVLQACIIAATTIPEALTELTKYQGRMDPLPNWVLEGAIIGLQGGDQVVCYHKAVGWLRGFETLTGAYDDDDDGDDDRSGGLSKTIGYQRSINHSSHFMKWRHHILIPCLLFFLWLLCFRSESD